MDSKHKLFYNRTGRETEHIFVTKVRHLITTLSIISVT
jgi:hypothetical protein